MEKNELRELISGTLRKIGLYSDDATELLMGTCAQESCLGKYRRQLGGGPALGIFQMEPATFTDIYMNYLRYKPELLEKVMKVAEVTELKPSDLENNDVLAAAMARVHYLRVKEGLPSRRDVWGMGEYWKLYYNTPEGKGTESEFVGNYKKYVL